MKEEQAVLSFKKYKNRKKNSIETKHALWEATGEWPPSNVGLNQEKRR